MEFSISQKAREQSGCSLAFPERISMNLYLDLFFTFFRIGLFTFGGGYAMLAILEDTCVEGKHWITHEEMMDITVIAESTPGPIAINCATYTGYKRAGFPGAVAATLGMIVPSFLVIFLISLFLDNFLEIKIIANAFRGIQIGVGVLILNAAVTMLQKMPRKPLTQGIWVCACLALLLGNLFARNISSIMLMLLGGAVSLAVYLGKERGGK